MKAKISNLLLVIFSLFYLGACGGKEKDSTEGQELSDTPTESEERTEPGKTREQEQFDAVNLQLLEQEEKTRRLEQALAAQESAATITITNGWTNYSGDYRTASVRKEENLCIVSGLIKNGGWGQLAILSENCRPQGRLIFNVNNHAKTARVDVFPSGEIKWVAGGQDHGWISLDGIAFSVEGDSSLTLANGWLPYGGDYKAPSLTREGTLCVVSGLIKGGNWSQLAMLPEECRPSGRLIFNVNNHAKTARVDVFPSGEIKWVAGGQDHGWISLDGVAFSSF